MKTELRTKNDSDDRFPALFASASNKTILLATNKFENHLTGFTVSSCPSWEAGYFSKTWEADSFTRLAPGSTVILTQE